MVEALTTIPPLKRPEFRKLLAISITIAIGFGMIIPILPRYAKSFGVGLAAVGLVQFVFGLTRFSFGLVGGLIVDRFGERASVITGILVVAASSFAAGLSDSFGQLVLARGFGGAGSALFIAGLMNRIVRIIEPEAMGRATGAFRASFLVGIGVGPLFGGILAENFSLTAPFHIYGTGLLIATVIAWFVLAEQPGEAEVQTRSPREALAAAKPLFKDLRYVVALLATFVGWWTISGPTQTVGVVFADERLRLSDFQIGLAVTMLAIGEVAVLMWAGRAADRYGRRAVLVPSLAVTAAATVALGQLDESSAWGFFPLMIAIGAGIAAGGAAAGGLLGDAVPRGGSGAAIGVNQMAGDLGYLIAPTLIGAIAEHNSFATAYMVGAIPSVLVIFAVLKLPQRPGTRTPNLVVEPSEPVG